VWEDAEPRPCLCRPGFRSTQPSGSPFGPLSLADDHGPDLRVLLIPCVRCDGSPMTNAGALAVPRFRWPLQASVRSYAPKVAGARAKPSARPTRLQITRITMYRVSPGPDAAVLGPRDGPAAAGCAWFLLAAPTATWTAFAVAASRSSSCLPARGHSETVGSGSRRCFEG
jgi:hypothetical protein